MTTSVTKKLPQYGLYAAIAVILYLLLQEWSTFSKEFDKQKKASITAVESVPLQTTETPLLSSDDNPLSGVQEPVLSSNETNSSDIATASTDQISNQASNALSRLITVKTDTLRVTVDRLGGDIVEVALLKHLESLEPGAEPLRLLEKNAQRTYIAQSGLIGDNGSNVKSARALFLASTDYYEMNDKETLSVNLSFKDASGVLLTKTFTFRSNDYLIDVSYEVSNKAKTPWSGVFYSQISRDNTKDPGTEDAAFGMQSYLGAATTTEDSNYKKISFKDIEKENFRNTQIGGWVAMIQHYFVSAWIPNQEETQNFYTKKGKNGQNIIGFYSKPINVANGEKATVSSSFYAGPKDQYRLDEIAKHLGLTVDFGWLWMISQPLYALLHMFATGDLHVFDKVFHVFPGFGNWGVAIIALTIVVKLFFFKLSAASYRSMANMRRMQPKLMQLRERYSNDKQAQTKAMMELYQKEKINPLGGCLPMLVQMPVFIALYWALIESVELRHAPFMLWIKDLSVMDPYFVLPLIMGGTMYFQQKMNPAPPDPMQAKVMQWMPVIFTFFFLWFPAGLVIYWVSNNILSMLQQWVITRNIEKEGAKT